MQQPVIFTLFGIAGDLSRNKLLPALFDLFITQQLPEEFSLIGFGRREWSRDDFKQFIAESLKKDIHDLKPFLDRCEYIKGDLDTPGSFDLLATKIIDIEQESTLKLFYLSLAPEFYGPVSAHLAHAKLNTPNSRLLIEKPFGTNYETAQDLDNILHASFDESQIYRIDHYLAKTSVKAILDFRFLNHTFEPIWNSQHIAHIAITLAESGGIGTRAGYYDHTGAVRDMVQNHALALASLFLMPTPPDSSAEAIRSARIRALQSLTAMSWTLGQYESYHQEANIPTNSHTETYASVEFASFDNNWHSVPIRVITGKALQEKRSEITITFKPNQSVNSITFQIAPNPGIIIRTNQEEKVIPLEESGDGYSAVIVDAMRGNQSFFISSDEVRAAWKAITPILSSENKLTSYPLGASYPI